MPSLPQVTQAQIIQFLAAARETIAAVPVCWLCTRSLEGGTNARAVNSSAGAPGSDEWTRRFLVRRSFREVAEMRAAPLITLAYQHPFKRPLCRLRWSSNDLRGNRRDANDVVERPK
jgi:hypothetical protein